MILNFLQTRNPPVLPCLHKRPHQRLKNADGSTSAFADDIESLKSFGHRNKETLGELLFHFFRRYGHEIDYEKHVISVREGALILKEEKRWHLMQNNRLCVEEPFNIERNLGNTADDISFRGVHTEIRRAFNLLAEAKLDECMQEYVFPVVEERLWEKPPPKPLPVISRSRSQSQSGRGGRGGYSNRNHRYGHHQYQHQQRNGPQGRRASSAAASQKHPNLPGVMASNPRDQPMQVHLDGLQLNEDLVNKFQLLQAQEAELRYIQQAQIHAQLTPHPNSGPKPPAHAARRSSRDDANPLIGSLRHPPSTAPLHNGAVFPPFSYNAAPMLPQSAVHTNPSSPSMKPVQPDLRRAAHRTPDINASAGINMRSHSQPPRPVNLNQATQHQHPDLLNDLELQQYQQARQQQHVIQILEAQNRARTAMLPQAPFHADRNFDDSSRYAGFYMHDPSNARQQIQDPYGVRARAYKDIQQHIRGVQAGRSRLQDPSRSPSPSAALPYRDRSMSTRSTASAPLGPVLMDRDQLSASGLRSSGPVIVDGSDGWEPNRQQSVGGSDFDQAFHEGNLAMSRQRPLQPSMLELEHQFQGMHFGALPAESMRSRYPARSQREAFPITDNAQTHLEDSPVARERSRVNGVIADTLSTATSGFSPGENGLGIAYGTSSPQSQLAQIDSLRPRRTLEATTIGGKEGPGQHLPKDEPIPNINKLLSPVREVATPTSIPGASGSTTTTPTKATLAKMYPIQDIPPFKGQKNARAPVAKAIQKPLIPEIPPFRGKPSAPPAPSQPPPSEVIHTSSPPPRINGISPNNLSYAERVARGANYASVVGNHPVSKQQPNGLVPSLADVSNAMKQLPRGPHPSYAERVNAGLVAPDFHHARTAPRETSPSPKPTAMGNGNEWQQSVSKKHKRNKSRNATGQLGMFADDERKGG